MIDIHLHILPGLDDGARDMDEAAAMCRLALEDGATALVATPHMLDGVYDTPPDAARQTLAELRERLAQESIDLRVEIGGDVHIAPNLARLVQDGKVLTVADQGRHIMIELPEDVLPARLADLLFEVQLANLTPIISHPERNLAAQAAPDALLPLVKAGSLVQITAKSLVGGFGRRAQNCAASLVERRMAHFVASDAHGATRRRPGLSKARAVVAGIVGEEEARMMFVERPARLLEGVHVPAPEPRPSRRHRRRWLFW